MPCLLLDAISPMLGRIGLFLLFVMPFLTKQEVADMLHCSVRHVERLLHEGLPFIPIGSRKKLYSAEAITQWLLSRQVIIPPPKQGISRRIERPNAYTDYCDAIQAKREARKRKA